MRPVYMDYCATTALDPRVLTVMQPFLQEKFGNSNSALHAYGWEADHALQAARQTIATNLGCTPHEISFTSGATESNAWALRGVIENLLIQKPTEKIHILSSPIEHKSVMLQLQYIQQLFSQLHPAQVEVELVPVQNDGRVRVADIEARIRPSTKLFSFMWVNNELGSINPIHEIGELAHAKHIYFHCDGTQALGKFKIDLSAHKIDLLSLSAHKAYGPKGVGLLYARNRAPHVQLQPLLWGGGQERGGRSGTVNVPGIVGFAEAVRLCSELQESESLQMRSLFAQLLKDWENLGLPFRLNGAAASDWSARVPHVMNVTLLGKPLATLAGIAYSKGAACHSDQVDISHVLQNIGLSAAEAENTYRFSFGRSTTLLDLAALTEQLKRSL